MVLIDRGAERRLLDAALRDVGSGHSRVLVLHGDPGVGKSALLKYLASQAAGCRLFRAAVVESEMELAYAALHQLCAPMLDHLEHLAPPQRDALGTAFGLSAGPPPDRFLIGLAVLSLLSDVADEQPLLCLVDDVQWLDRASAQALAFVGRRLGAESVALVVASRVVNPEMAALPGMHVEGLREADARALLDAVLTVPLDERVRDQFVAETGDNPLALLELPRGLGVHELAGGFGLPGAEPLSAAVEESFRRGVQALPAQTRRLLLLAAAEPLGDPVLLWRAAARLGIGTAAAAPAAAVGLAEFGLTRAANTAPKAARRRNPVPQGIRPSVQRVLDGMADVAAIVMNGRLDLLATSTLGAALYSPVCDDPARPANLARFCFFSPQARALYPHWDEAANTTVAMLRTEAGRHPYDRDLSDLIGELSTRSDTFRDRWANHNVRLHRTGAKVYQHPVVGKLTLEFEVMDLSADEGLALTAFTAADPASRDGLKLLASWAATLDHDDERDVQQSAAQKNRNTT